MATLFVGNLAAATTDNDLKELFGLHGEVESVNVPTDWNSGRSRGFALIEMASGAEAAMRAVTGLSVGGRRLVVTPAAPRPTRSVPAVKLS